MSTWAVWAAKEAAVATGLGAGVLPAVGAASLDAFAAGALLTGACFVAFTFPRRSKRSRRHVLAGGPASPAAPVTSAGRSHDPRHGARVRPSRDPALPPAPDFVPQNPPAQCVAAPAPTADPAAVGLAPAADPLGQMRPRSPSGHPYPDPSPQGPLSDPVSEIVVPAQADGPWPVPGLSGAPWPVAGTGSDHRHAPRASEPGAPYQSRHRRDDDAAAAQETDYRRTAAPRHAAPVGRLATRVTGFPVRPLTGAARN
ncbi:MAG: hypothetical protein ACLQI7_04710 [Streptosporangiaceae bacterium]